MYVPKVFAEDRLEVLQTMIQTHPLATLIVSTEQGLEANHFPMVLHTELSEKGTLRAHIARANPLWKLLKPNSESLAIFQGDHTYISPSWYPTKQETGKAVPTWNYVAVHAYGNIKIIEDSDWLYAHLTALSDRHEANFPEPWAVTDAPENYIEKMIKAIVGIELPINRITGKWKISQNQPEGNQQGVMTGLNATQQPNAVKMASLIAHHRH